MRQCRHDGHLRRVEPLVGHRHRHQDRGLGQQPEGGQGLVRIAFGRGCEADVWPGLLGRHPAPKRIEVDPRRGLVGRHDQELAQAPHSGTRRKPPLSTPFGAKFARGLEGLAQQFDGEAGAQGRKQGRPRRLGRVRA